MTLVVVWKTEDRLMAVADTRIIRSEGNVLTEHGPKLLPITIVCRQPGESGFFDREVYRADIGFAYSGSTLSALASHALATTLCSNLIGARGAVLPSLADIAHFVAGVGAEYMRDVCQLAGKHGIFTAILFGWCPQSNTLRTFKLTPNFAGSQFQMHISEHNLAAISLTGSAEESALIIGSSPQLLSNAINEDLAAACARSEVHPIVAYDAPKRALQDLIAKGVDEKVGGSIQQAWATQLGFRVVANTIPIKPKPPSPRNAGLFVLGFDTFDIQNVGSYRVSLEGR